MHRLLIGKNCSRLARLLDTLGAACTELAVEDFASQEAGPNGRIAIILSEADLVEMAAHARKVDRPLATLFPGRPTVLIWPFEGGADAKQALNELIGGEVQIVPIETGAKCKIADDRETCGAFAGLEFAAGPALSARGFVVRNTAGSVEHLVELGGAGLVARIALPMGDVFVAAAKEVFDIDLEVTRNLDAIECFAGLVPLLFFLRHCRIPFWRSTQCWGNLIIDDPTLKPDYGFVQMRQLAEKVEELQCAVTIGFIPWNFNRTARTTVEMFRAHRPRLSICMHGCDHTGGEFATRSSAGALELAALGLERMGRMASATSLPFDKVMVFPQGRFSAAAMQALRQTDLLGAVNTELLDCVERRGVLAGELLKPAITSYSGFPLFMRRPGEASMADFALDLLLGKPCLIVTHHEYFKGGLERFTSLIQSLKRLEPSITWTNLEKIVQGSFSIRVNPDSVADIRLFSAKTEVSIPDAPSKLRFQKAELANGEEFQAHCGGRKVPSRFENGILSFDGDSAAREQHVTIESGARKSVPTPRQSLKYRVKVSARRYLSEVRDNYVAKSPALTSLFASMRPLLAKRRT